MWKKIIARNMWYCSRAHFYYDHLHNNLSKYFTTFRGYYSTTTIVSLFFTEKGKKKHIYVDQSDLLHLLFWHSNIIIYSEHSVLSIQHKNSRKIVQFEMPKRQANITSQMIFARLLQKSYHNKVCMHTPFDTNLT